MLINVEQKRTGGVNCHYDCTGAIKPIDCQPEDSSKTTFAFAHCMRAIGPKESASLALPCPPYRRTSFALLALPDDFIKTERFL